MSDFPPVIILAGGVATRLGAISQQVPKAMMPVAGAPFIDHQLRLLSEKGITTVVLSVAHLSKQIEDFVGDGARYRLKVSYADDGPVRLGTGGAIRAALDMVPDDFAILYGDTFLDIEYLPVFAAYKASGRLGLMTVLNNDNNWDTSNVIFRDGVIQCYSKKSRTAEMCYIDYGLSIVNKQCFADFPSGEAFDLAEVFERRVSEGQIAGFEVQKRFYEIGTPDALAQTNEYLRARRQVV